MMEVLLAAVMFCGPLGGTQAYGGPKSLGPFRIDRDVSMDSLFDRLGGPPKLTADTYCYQSADRHAFLVLTRMVEVYDPRVAGDVVLSSFPNCVHRPVQVTAQDLANWKTEGGVGLGDTVEDVLKAYGRPSRETKVEGTKFRWVIQGDLKGSHYSNQKRPEIGETVLVYQGPSNDIRIAEFGIAKGKVVWISLSKNE